jgi:cytochrome c oxidase subunit IV
VVLTVLTFITARMMHTGIIHTPLAITIATVKAGLVVWFFMHLGEHGMTNRVFFASSVLFVLLMIGLIVADVAMRPQMSNPNYAGYDEKRGPW